MTARKKEKGARHLRPVPVPDVAAGPPWRLLWHPEATAEREQINNATDRVAIQHAGDKLVAAGPRLPFPHQSAVQGQEGKGMRELRPRRGRCVWRPIYRQVDPRTFVVLAVAPEAQSDQKGFDRAIARARARFDSLEL
jgi:hypothetical protein